MKPKLKYFIPNHDGDWKAGDWLAWLSLTLAIGGVFLSIAIFIKFW